MDFAGRATYRNIKYNVSTGGGGGSLFVFHSSPCCPSHLKSGLGWEAGAWSAGWNSVSRKPSVDRPAALQFIDAFCIEQADLSQLVTFTKCRRGDNLIEPSFSVLKPLSKEL